jgi:hypothetical protein
MKDKFENMFNKAIEYLIQIAELCSHSSEINFNEINLYIHYCLENAEIYDFISSKNIKLDNFNSTNVDTCSDDLKKQLLNYSHDKGDIFLAYDIEIFNSQNNKKIQLSTYRYLLEIILDFFILNLKSLLISDDYKDLFLKKIYLQKIKLYTFFGFENIPPFRIWNYENQKMTTISAVPILPKIEQITSELDSKTFSKTKLDNRQKEFLIHYYTKWWDIYKQIIDKEFPVLNDKFEYYKGAEVKIYVVDYKQFDKIFGISKLALCVGIKKSEFNDLFISINENIEQILFVDDKLDDYSDVTVTVAFDFDYYSKDIEETLQSSIKHELEEQLFQYYKSTIDENQFNFFSKQTLLVSGYKILEKENKEFVYKNDFISNEEKRFEILRYSKIDEKLIEEQIKRHHPKSNLLIISNSVVRNKKKINLSKSNNVFVKDTDDFFTFAKHEILNNPLFSNLIFEKCIYPYLETKHLNLKSNKETVFANKLIDNLKNCPTGIKGWKQYEKLSLEIIKFCFENKFRNLRIKEQVRNCNGTDIKDFVIINTGISDFWKDLKQFYNCKNIIIESKNSDNEIGIEELRQVSDYLEKETIGQFAIIFSRKGLSQNGFIKQKDYLTNRTKKLILVLDDNDIIDLLRKKANDDTSEEIFENMIFEIETKI